MTKSKLKAHDPEFWEKQAQHLDRIADKMRSLVQDPRLTFELRYYAGTVVSECQIDAEKYRKFARELQNNEGCT